MGRRLSSAAIAVGALVLDPIVGSEHWARDVERVQLERLTAATFPVSDASGTPAARGVRDSGHDIPLSGDRQHVIVDGTINGSVSGPMLIDTGASYCVLTRETARRLGIRPRSHRSIPVATANGRVDADLVELDALEIRDVRLASVEVVIMDAVEPPLIGIIGLNFLREFRFSVDLARGNLRLEP